MLWSSLRYIPFLAPREPALRPSATQKAFHRYCYRTNAARPRTIRTSTLRVRPTAPPYHKTPVTPTTARTDRACTAFSLPRWRPTRHLRKEPEPPRTSRTRLSGARTPRRATTDRPPRRKSALPGTGVPVWGQYCGVRPSMSKLTYTCCGNRATIRSQRECQLSPANFEADSPGPSNIVTRGSSAADGPPRRRSPGRRPARATQETEPRAAR